MFYIIAGLAVFAGQVARFMGPPFLIILPNSAGMRQPLTTFINICRVLTISRVIYIGNLEMSEKGTSLTQNESI
jgi:hypothetical protein